MTDAGEGYLKAIGNPEGEHVLACEWVATHLARQLGLPTFDFSLIEVTDVDEIPLPNGGKAKSGPAFITRAEKGGFWSGKRRELKRLTNPSDISRLVVFDTWTLNCDRYYLPKKRCNRSNVFLSREAPPGKLLLRAMDHTHCFTCGGELTRTITHIDRVRESVVYGCFPEFDEFVTRDAVLAATDTLRSIPHNYVEDVIQSVPPEWQVNGKARAALADLVSRRAAYVAEHIMDWIRPQNEFEFMNPAEGEP
ncbi:MAG: hypothetical protein NTW96_03360 [Planctomycetia bacterium]|nr:hypothetical protein [Planctomycetia bacterium]